MKKFKVGISFYLLVLLCVLTKNIMLLFNYFVALILHELAHLWVATSKGYKLQQMHLSICGLFIKLDEQIEDKDSFLINIAGPSLNLLLSIFCLAIFWLVPASYNYLNSFCISNLALAVFNLLPVYPLDGGKIINGLFKNNKRFKILNIVTKLLFIALFAGLFIYSCFNVINYFYLIMAIFFITLKDNHQPTISVFKFGRKSRIERIIMLKIQPTETLFSLLKQLKNSAYIIFYCKEHSQQYLDEDSVITLSTKHPLTTQICNIKNDR